MIIVTLSFALSDNPSLGLSLLLGVMIMNSYFVAAFHERKGINSLLCGDNSYIKIKKNIVLLTTIFDQCILIILLFLYICQRAGRVDPLTLIYTMVVTSFMISVGMLVGVFCKNQKVALIICALLCTVNFLKVLFLEETLRFFSPVLQLANMDTLQWWNLATLGILAITLVCFIYHNRKRVLVAGGIAIAVIIAADVSLSERSLLPADYKQFASAILEDINIINRASGFDYYENIEVYKSIYYPWESATEKRVVYANNDTLFMNCFTESLCALEEQEITMRTVYSLLDPDTAQQRAIADLYIEHLLGNDDNITGFLAENQINEYGAVVSKNFALYAEILINHPEQLAKLYEVTKKYTTSDEIVRAWNDTDI
jgi:hypothetical protein